MFGLSMPMPNAVVATMIETSSARNVSCRRSRSFAVIPPW
jgi:hypothetical protein